MAEHLISVVSQNHQPLRITYNGPIWDNEPWSTFPNRQGWEPALLLENHKGSIPHTYAEAMECWLFFGTLHASFGDIFQQNDFIRMTEQPYITTSCLHRYLDLALSRGKSKFLQNLRSTLNLVLVQIEKRRVCDCIRPSMLFAIVVLLGSLMNFFRGKSDVDNAFKGGMQFRYAVAAREWADGELIGQGWCPSDVGRFSDTSLHYFILRAYALQMIRPRTNNRAEVIHSKCTLVECADNYIDNHTYVTKHVRSDCNCEHIGPDIEAVKKILEKGGTPLVRISTSNDDTALRLDVVQNYPGRRYVAISHVWSDGLGNVGGNSLPLCQLKMLQKQGRDAIDLSPAFLPAADNPIFASATVLQHWAGSVAKLADQSTLVWIDTLCVPRERETRNLAIKGMKKAYANAYKTLVLDSELRSITARKRSKEEILFRVLYCSGWMRRLWTLQEGLAGGRSLCVAFSDILLNVADLAEKLWDKVEGSRCSLLTVAIPIYCFAHWAQWFSNATDTVSTFTTYWSMLERLALVRRRKDDIEHSCWLVAASWDNVGTRASSRDEDRPVILAGIANLDPSSLLEIRGDAEMRMMEFYKLQPFFPKGILFASGPRFENDGWRWAVKVCKRQDSVRRLEHMTSEPGERRPEGLLVAYPGVFVTLESAIKPVKLVDTTGFFFKLGDPFVHDHESLEVSRFVYVSREKSTVSQTLPELPIRAIGILFEEKTLKLAAILERKAVPDYRVRCVIVAVYRNHNGIHFARYILQATMSGFSGTDLPADHMRRWHDLPTITDTCEERRWCVG